MSSLGHLNDVRAEAAVLRGLGDTEQAVRVHAAKAAGRLHLQSATPALAALLTDPNWWVRYRAAEALHSMGTIGQTFLKARSKERDDAGAIAAQVLAEKEAA
jgi:HEAT repeat protein